MQLQRILLALVLSLPLIAAACRREGEAVERRAQMVRGTHPWDSPEYKSPVPEMPSRAARPDESAAVSTPADRGPSLPTEDTLTEPAILGRYLQVCQVVQEKMNLIPVDQQDILNLQPNGYATWTGVNDGTTKVDDGSWKKSKPGALELAFGGGSVEMYGQLYQQDFLYLWSYENRTGFWFVRLPERASPRLLANKFGTSRGYMEISRYVGSSFEGQVSGETPLIVSGFYNSGILAMRWESEKAGGFATFLVSEDNKTMRGCWWIDDWEAAPFGGDWIGQSQ
ncbi:hypothetical protein IT575_06590 [bacterium]|nr:hypothetical protein [bacterium]